MTIQTRSKFYYGHTITQSAYTIPLFFGSEVTANLNVGTYALTEFIEEVERALNSVGGQVYTVSVNRDTRFITISATSNFQLLFSTGQSANSSIYTLLGFTQSDFTGSNSYTGTLPSGSEWRPQFLIQDYLDFENNQESIQSVVNESASGVVEVVSYGSKKIMSGNFKFINDSDDNSKYSPVEYDADGVLNARKFLVYAIGKGDIEFMPDRDNSSQFTTCFLESTPESKQGTAFELKELYSQNLTGYFETGELKFRKVVR